MKIHPNDGDGASKELIDLICALLDGIATPVQRKRLNGLLRSDTTVRAIYDHFINLHLTLSVYASGLAGKDDDDAARQKTPTWWRTARLRWLVAAITGGIAAAFFAFSLIPNRPSVTRPMPSVATTGNVVAHFTRLTGARLAGAKEPPVVGGDFKAGTLELVRGFAEITLANNVRIVLESPVTLQLPSPGSATLISGSLVATVPPDARGFAIDTPRARVVDLGTEFGVGVSDGDTEVQVFRGLVVTEWRAPGGKTVEQRLTVGNALSIGANVQSVPRSIPFEPERFIRMFPTDTESIQPAGPVYNSSRVHVVNVIPISRNLTIDGDLSDWDAGNAFFSACEPPYRESHYVRGMMMYDREYLYIGAHIGDPAPMRSTMDPQVSSDQYAWRGGSVIVRLAVDPKLGWPLQGMGREERSLENPAAGTRPQDVTDKIAHIEMWYHRPSRRAKLHLSFGMNFHGIETDPPGWKGAFKMDPDGLGYSLEYAIPWSLLNVGDHPPMAGDTVGTTWTVHWSDQEGRISRGHLAEITNPQAGPFRFLRAATWGKAIFQPQQFLPMKKTDATTRPGD